MIPHGDISHLAAMMVNVRDILVHIFKDLLLSHHEIF